MRLISAISCFIILFVQISCSKNSLEYPVPEHVVYKIIEDDTLTMDLYKPNGFKKDSVYPTLVFFFGGGWIGGSVDQLRPQAEYFASRGMVTVLVDYRVKKKHGTTPFEAVADAKSAMRFLKTHAKSFHIKKNKIIASGASAGGHLAAATAMLPGLDEAGEDLKVSTKAQALILYNPVIDNGPGGYGYERIGDRYTEISPMYNIFKDVPPTLIFQGTKDKHIPNGTMENYKAKIEAVGGRCELHLYEGQLHGFFNKGRQPDDKYYIETTLAADEFLQSLHYLKGKSTV
ncbi:alpha/beta hydrolase [Formosa sediminum]|uniref:Alpha/beta hydrolase n=1 Tax=Formosa sediminum TaxID=2594004 RepID=A0A516GSD2_9FLAO|nr:alpha/beta hydrolase [Formosa sediminum]QDO94280.1 alpha/beta hydrolase [Formosa sediminum]